MAPGSLWSCAACFPRTQTWVPIPTSLLLPPSPAYNPLLLREVVRGHVSILPKLISLVSSSKQLCCTGFLHLTLHKPNSLPQVTGLKTGATQSPDDQMACEWGQQSQIHPCSVGLMEANNNCQQPLRKH